MERVEQELNDYPGRLTTPVITSTFGAQYWTVDELVRRSREASERELAKRKTMRGKVEHWIWIIRHNLARWIDPDA